MLVTVLAVRFIGVAVTEHTIAVDGESMFDVAHLREGGHSLIVEIVWGADFSNVEVLHLDAVLNVT